MLGVVLWSSHRRRKAVIWCEDQQALAYLRDDAVISGGWPEAGDIVEVEVMIETDAQGALRVVTRLDHQPGRMPVVPHLPSSPRPPLWIAGQRTAPDAALSGRAGSAKGPGAAPAEDLAEDDNSGADTPKSGAPLP